MTCQAVLALLLLLIPVSSSNNRTGSQEDVIVCQPRDKVSASCPGTAVGRRSTVTWYKDGKEVHTRRLVLTVKAEDHGSGFLCQRWSRDGWRSSVGVVRIWLMRRDTAGTKTPTTLRHKLGSVLRLTCSTLLDGDDHVTWISPDGLVFNDANRLERNLSSRNDFGYYGCRALLLRQWIIVQRIFRVVDSTMTPSKMLRTYVARPSDKEDLIICEIGENVLATCPAESVGQPSRLTWENEDRRFLFRRFEMTVKAEDEGVYVCRRRRSDGRAMSVGKVKLLIIKLEENGSKIPTTLRHKLGSVLRLTCSVLLKGDDHVTWISPDGLVINDANRLERKLVTLRDFGNYRCRARLVKEKKIYQSTFRVVDSSSEHSNDILMNDEAVKPASGISGDKSSESPITRRLPSELIIADLEDSKTLVCPSAAHFFNNIIRTDRIVWYGPSGKSLGDNVTLTIVLKQDSDFGKYGCNVIVQLSNGTLIHLSRIIDITHRRKENYMSDERYNPRKWKDSGREAPISARFHSRPATVITGFSLEKKLVIECPRLNQTYDRLTTEETVSWTKDGESLDKKGEIIEIAKLQISDFGKYECTRTLKDKGSGSVRARFVASLIVREKKLAKCRTDQMKCEVYNGQEPHSACVLKTMECNGVWNCENGWDERPEKCERILPGCGAGELQCQVYRLRAPNSPCVRVTQMCDLTDHCGNGWDERRERCQATGLLITKPKVSFSRGQSFVLLMCKANSGHEPQWRFSPDPRVVTRTIRDGTTAVLRLKRPGMRDHGRVFQCVSRALDKRWWRDVTIRFDGKQENCECKPDEILCRMQNSKIPLRRCIHRNRLCDGIDDCGNGWDEICKDVQRKRCLGQRVRCSSGQHINFRQVCDGKSNCEDKSDEQHCNAPTVTYPAKMTRRLIVCGNRIVLNCTAEGNPPPTISWQFKETCLPRNLEESSQLCQSHQGSTVFTVTSTLVISRIQRHMLGDYKCVASSGTRRGIGAAYQLMEKKP